MASVALASHQFPLELPPPLAGTGVIGHAERAMVDRFLTALHGSDGRRHQQVRQLADGALAAREQVAGHIQRGNRRGSPQRERSREAGQQ
ncbi:hypothetical protein OURE66S_03564 [Oligella ureolytica]